MDFGRPNAKNGWKMASGQLLFLALIYTYIDTTVWSGKKFLRRNSYIDAIELHSLLQGLTWKYGDIKVLSTTSRIP